VSDKKYYVTENVGYGLEVFVTYSQNYCGYAYTSEKAALDEAIKRAQASNKAYSVVQMIATVMPEPIKPAVTVVR